MAANIVEICHPNHNSLLFETLHNFALNEKFTDLCFVCSKNKKVFTHKLLLCSVSDEMKQIIMDVPQTNEMITIHIPDVKKSTVNLIVSFLYSGSMRLSQEQYKDFQDTMKLLGIVLTVNVGNEQLAQQPAPVATPVVQDTMPQPSMFQPSATTSAQDPGSQYVIINQATAQGVQYILPEHTQYANISQPSNNMIPVREGVQVVPAVQTRNNVQARHHQSVQARNTNAVLLNQMQQQQAIAPNTGQYQVVQRSNQLATLQQNNVQFGVGPGGGRSSTYGTNIQQTLQNNSSQFQNTPSQTTTNIPGILRRRRRLEQQQGQSAQLQLEDSSTNAKRKRDST